MISFLFESSVCLVLFVGLYALLLRSQPDYVRNRWYLLCAVMISLVIPFLAIPVYPPEAPGAESVVRTTSVLSDKAWSMTDILIWIYFAGVLITGIRYVVRFANVFALSRALSNQSFAQVKPTQPFSIFNHVYIPADITGEARDIILAHEKVHMRYGHSYDLVFIEIISIVLWFNPAIYLLKEYLREVHEYAADNITCQTLQLNMTTYLQLIHRIAGRPTIENPHINTFASFIKKRILMLTTTRQTSSWRYLLTIPMIATMLVMFSFCSAQDKTTPVEVTKAPQYIVDTVITFDPNTYEERVVIYQVPVEMGVAPDGKPMSTQLDNQNQKYSLDTIIVYDPATQKETMTVVRVVEKKKEE